MAPTVGLDIQLENERPTSDERDSSISLTLSRGLQVLELLAERGPINTREIADTMGLSQTVVYRLLRTLGRHGFVDARPGGGRYGIVGLKFLTMSRTVYKDFHQVVWPILHDLANELDATAFIGVQDINEVACVMSAESDNARVTVRYRPGHAQPLTVGASGSVIRAMDPAYEGEEPGVILTRKLGYATSEHEVESYTSAISVPLHPDAGQNNSCVTVVFPKPYLDNTQATVSLLKTAAAGIEEALGGERAYYLSSLVPRRTISR